MSWSKTYACRLAPAPRGDTDGRLTRVWGNRHVVTALLVAPVLALIAYFAVDRLVAERPQPAQPGLTYKLVAGPGCRPARGRCEVRNGDVRLLILAEALDGSELRLIVRPSLPPTSVVAGIAPSPGATSMPVALRQTSSQNLEWSGTVARPIQEDAMLQIAATISGSHYLAEIPAAFLQPPPTH